MKKINHIIINYNLSMFYKIKKSIMFIASILSELFNQSFYLASKKSSSKHNKALVYIALSCLCIIALPASYAQSITFGTAQPNPFGLIDIGTRSDPTFVDLDNDGDLDLMTGSNTGDFYYFENEGTNTLPNFAVGILNPFSLSDVGLNSSPVFIDLNGDGKFDLMAGNNSGDFHYFENTGTVASPVFAVAVMNPFSLASNPNPFAPSFSFADLNNDGKMDLMSGNHLGNFYYYENTGTTTIPVFATVVVNPFSLSQISSFLKPSLIDLDGDGLYDLMSGSNNPGNFYYFKNTGTNSVPVFGVMQTNPFALSKILIGKTAFADLDNDGDLDILCGSGDGNFYYFENSPPVTWDGDTDTNWNTATNWDGGIIPTSSDTVLIPSGLANYPVTLVNNTINKLIINSGASLTINTNSITVNDDITINGTLIVNSGASLLPLGDILGSGNAVIHRKTTFVVSAGRYSVVGSPITSGNTNMLGSIVYGYDETVAYGANGNNRFFSAMGQAMTVGDAYFTANTGSISFTGTPNSGNINVLLTLNSGEGANAGFNLVSNPYTAAISYSDFATANTDIDGTIYLWDDGGSDVSQRTNSDYITANSMGAATGGLTTTRAGDWDGYIRSSQGFFVKATKAGTLVFTPSMMTAISGSNTDGGFFRTGKPTVLRFSLSSLDFYSDILIGFTENATLDYDRTLDAYKVKGNNNLQLYSRMQDEILAIQALPKLDSKSTIVSIGFDAAEAGTYTFNIKDPSQYDFQIHLIDHLLLKNINLSEINSYAFESEAVDNSARFSLVFLPNTVLAIDDKVLSNDMIVYSNNDLLHVKFEKELSNATVRIYNLSGRVVNEYKNVNFKDTAWQTTFNKEGLHIIMIQANDGELFVKKFIKN